MQIADIEKANDIIKLIDENKKAISVLEDFLNKGGSILAGKIEFNCIKSEITLPKEIIFEDWEIRLMIHNKKQRIAALEKQLKQL